MINWNQKFGYENIKVIFQDFYYSINSYILIFYVQILYMYTRAIS